MKNEYQSAIHSQEYVNERALYVLETLGLDWEDVRGKQVLDLGAGNAELARSAIEQGIDTVQSIDIDLELQDPTVKTLQHYIQGDAATLPFSDETFDLVVSHAAPPTLNEKPAEIVAIMNEVLRVLKPGGEFRFGPDFTMHDKSLIAVDSQGLQDIIEKHFPEVERRFIRVDDHEPHADVFVYSLRKPGTLQTDNKEE